MSNKIKIAYFYKDQLNLYGDNGNIEILYKRCEWRNISCQVDLIDEHSKIDSPTMKSYNIVFMGGGPDSGQKSMYKDLLNEKGSYLKDYVEEDGIGLFICGSYQLLGNFYKASDGLVLEGLGIFDLNTEHFGQKSPRCIGNVSAKLDNRILDDIYFKNNNRTGSTIVGFENHGGRTFLKNQNEKLAQVIIGNGNNSKDGTEGIHYKNSLGTYFHGPFLSKNPHIADYLIAKALYVEKLTELDDTFINQAHAASLELKQ